MTHQISSLFICMLLLLNDDTTVYIGADIRVLVRVRINVHDIVHFRV
jgi:hypothetical protein